MYKKKQIELFAIKKNNLTYSLSLFLEMFLAIATFGNIYWTNFEDRYGLIVTRKVDTCHERNFKWENLIYSIVTTLSF